MRCGIVQKQRERTSFEEVMRMVPSGFLRNKRAAGFEPIMSRITSSNIDEHVRA